MFWNRNTASENKNYRKTAPKITQNRVTANPYAPLNNVDKLHIIIAIPIALINVYNH